ncbi:glycerophosphodiester phosphodiesterase [Longispora albida]|uniref:glycerophosphodiester phosphodiesterase n=1 Tax=Longispora albida TaxID=203523 RepID=UPI0009FC1326|nr:glycerophosphodiester phosphodiesterase [Longispora albida]
MGALTAGAVIAGQAGSAVPAFATPPARTPGQTRPLVIGHRGASGYRPEHTLAAYELAARMGADYIEPDLVSTKDHVLVARHENEISTTTDVASRPEFAGRQTTKIVDGVSFTGWFTEDFTLAELKTLRAVERLPKLRQHSTVFNGLFEVPTLQEILDLQDRLCRELRREIGVCPETKHPLYFQSIGLDLETPLAAALRHNGLNKPNSPVFVQSFDNSNLRDLRTRHKLRVPLAYLVQSPAQVTPAALAELATYANGIGPVKDLVIPRKADGTLGTATSLVADAHAAGLVVYPWTFRAENQFLPADYRSSSDTAAHGRAIDEQIAYLKAGVDGLFTDNPDIGALARTLWSA